MIAINPKHEGRYNMRELLLPPSEINEVRNTINKTIEECGLHVDHHSINTLIDKAKCPKLTLILERALSAREDMNKSVMIGPGLRALFNWDVKNPVGSERAAFPCPGVKA